MRKLIAISALLTLPALSPAQPPASNPNHAQTAESVQSRALIKQAVQLFRKGAFPRAEAVARQAVEQALASGPAMEHAHALHTLACVLHITLNLKEAEVHRRTILAILEAQPGKEAETAETLTALATLFVLQVRSREAELLIRRGLPLARGPASPLTRAMLLKLFGEVQYQNGDYTGALRTFESVLKLHDKIPDGAGDEEGSFHLLLTSGKQRERLMALTLNGAGTAALGSRSGKRAEQYLRRSIDLFRAGNAGPIALMSMPLANLGEILRHQERFQESEQHLNEALQLVEQAAGPDTFRAAEILSLMGATQMDAGEHQKARQTLERAKGVAILKAGGNHRLVGTILSNLAVLEMRIGNLQQADQMFLESINIIEQAAGKDHPLLLRALHGRAELLRRLKQSKLAKSVEARTNAIERTIVPGNVTFEELSAPARRDL